MANGTASFPLEKLRGLENYTNWKFQMKMLLIHEDLWDCVQDDKCQDEKRIQKALAKICLSVQSSIYGHVRNCKTAYEAWINLQKAYEDQGLCRRLSLLRVIFAMKYTECQNMDDYITKISDIAQQLSDIGAPLEDDFVAVILLSGLPSDYDPLIMALENSNTKLSSQIVKAKLQQECQRREDKSDIGTAFMVKKKYKCFRCKRPGHHIRNCPKNSSYIAGKDDKTNQAAKLDKSLLLTAMSVEIKRDLWYIDSGATSHMCNDKNMMSNFCEDKTDAVILANGDKIYTAGQGNVKVQLKNCVKTISEVHYVPKLSTNLLSVSAMTRKGFRVIFVDNCCQIYDNNEIVATASRINGIYRLDCEASGKLTIPKTFNMLSNCKVFPQIEYESRNNSAFPENQLSLSATTGNKTTQDIWHRRLGHLNNRSMQLLMNGLCIGVNYDITKYEACVACIKGKQTHLFFPKKSHSRATEFLGLVHTDLCGPMPVQSFGGAKYFLTFIDDFSRKTFVYFLRNKNEVFENFKDFKVFVENQTNKKIKELRSDNGGEYINSQFQLFLKKHGIRHQTTIPYSPQQNGVAERANRTIVEKARCMLQDARLDHSFWAEAVNTAIYLKNRSPTRALLGTTPEERWTDKKVNLSHLRIFGCLAYALTENRNKLDSKCKEYIFVGYCENSKGYRLIDPLNAKKCIKARNVTFIENRFFEKIHNKHFVDGNNIIYMLTANRTFNDNEIQSSDSSHTSSFDTPCQNIPTEIERSQIQEVISVDDLEEETTSESPDISDPTYIPGESSLEAIDSSDYTSESEQQSSESAHIIMMSCNEEPLTVSEALNGSEAEQWTKAMQDEYQSFLNNKCWTLTEPCKGQNPVRSKWVFKKKFGLDGRLIQYKARLVAKGYTQKYGIDYEETFSPVVRHSTIRLLFALAAEYNMEINHLDVKTAFLNGDLKETVFMEQPEGFKVKGSETKVYKLNKAIYGLKQASRSWYEKITDVLQNKLKFSRLSSEPCVFFRSSCKEIIIIALYVDDILLFTMPYSEQRINIKKQLMKEFEMKDLGDVHQFLGMQVRRNNGIIYLDQSTYIEKILKRFGMEECKPARTPMETKQKLVKAENCNDKLDFRNLIGCLMYVSVCTRPDIAHSVSVLSQFNNCYNESHWKAAKRVLRYLKGSLNYTLKFQKSGMDLSGYVDADWANSEFDRRSYTGYIFKIGNSVISWESRKQKTIALSSTEAEYMALSDSCKEALFIRTLLQELLGKTINIVIHNDNQSAQKLTKNMMFHARTKHIDVRHHFIRDIVAKNIISLNFMPTEKMPADFLTKPVNKERHAYFVKELGLTCI